MTLHQKIKVEVIVALKAKDTTKLNVLRGLLSNFTNEAVAKRSLPRLGGERPDEELSDEEVLTIISRAVKQRKDSIEQFEKGGRSELAAAEKAELVILESYLPTQMSREEVTEYVKTKIAEAGTVDKSKLGQFMGSIMKDLKGKADGTLVKEAIDLWQRGNL